MNDLIEDPAVTGNSISVNYIKDTAQVILVITAMIDDTTSVDRMVLHDTGNRLLLMSIVKPVVWDSQMNFDNWYAQYLALTVT
jgi:hypothetical protein